MDEAIGVPIPSEPSASNHTRRISINDNLLLRLPSGQIKPIRNLTPKTTISLGKFGKFEADHIIGDPFGLTYEIENGKLLKTSTVSSIDEIYKVDEIEATNENIKERDGAQKMTGHDIEQLKKSGLSGREIIERQIQQHSAFDLKSEFSKAKYIKRKEKKFLKRFTCIVPTVQNVNQYLFENYHLAIRGLRPDTLSQMLSLTNVRPGWRGIVVDDIGGLLVGAILVRMGGQGEVYMINNADSPPDLHLLSHLNLDESLLSPLKSLNWAQIDPNWSTPEIDEVLKSSQLNRPLIATNLTPANLNSIPSSNEEISTQNPDTEPSTTEDSILPSNKCDRPIDGNGESIVGRPRDKSHSKLKKKYQRYRELLHIRHNFLETEFEALITCSEYEPESILTTLSGRLSGSSSIAIYSPYLFPLSELQNRLKKSSSDYIHITIQEPWLRCYQVLPGRTHPEMNGTQGGGFILSAIKLVS